ncbi:hypothetical protein Acsp03_61770 [Actinomadura sp. NBRC 104412]|uniref:hypothetical protein n=1 Tax=Actinomadura sp. NBRC 104412 TaxID=3032203 RepID=UPI0024A11086|nr:hypothetical protein [Actinomadura sp. NBRC 104412]GLZ08711.1 hypothetical protein Acsp03_61770 [Actinomadura sp. NBRC 104412]
MAAERKKILLRLDPAVHDALARWAGDELRSTNAQIEYLLRKALADAGRMPRTAGRMRRPGRPPKNAPEHDDGDVPHTPPSEGRATSED